jgi:hypothetical protein
MSLRRLRPLAAPLAMALLSACPGPSGGALIVVNDAPQPIAEVNLSPAAQSTWGPNQIFASIGVGAGSKLSGVPSGTYDFRAVLEDGLTVVLAGIDIRAGATFTVTVAPTNGRVRALNSTPYTISAVYLSPAWSGSWGPPQNTSVIHSGGTFGLDDVPPGVYDFEAIDVHGTAYVLRSFVVNAGLSSTVNVR